MKKQINTHISGVTLVELMIALVISSILLLGVGTIYGTSKKTYSIDEEFARLQENARIALRYIVEDIRMAGYIGCAWNNGDTTKFQCFLKTAGSYACDNVTTGIEGFDAINTIANDSTAEVMTLTGTALTTGAGLIAAWDNNWINSSGGTAGNVIPAEFPAAARRPILDSDILIIRRAGGPGIKMTGTQNADNFTISDEGTDIPTAGTTDCHGSTGLCEQDILIVSDCNKARVFQATQITNVGADLQIEHVAAGTPGNAAPVAWGASGDTDNQFLENDTEIMKFNTFAYYVANNAADEPALYRHNGVSGSAPEELVEGIENLQILYGVDVTGDGQANRYTSANTIDFADTTTTPVVSVRISMLARTKEEIPTRPDSTNTYTMATTNITAITDKRLRKIFTTTVKIRNKGL